DAGSRITSYYRPPSFNRCPQARGETTPGGLRSCSRSQSRSRLCSHVQAYNRCTKPSGQAKRATAKAEIQQTLTADWLGQLHFGFAHLPGRRSLISTIVPRRKQEALKRLNFIFYLRPPL